MNDFYPPFFFFRLQMNFDDENNTNESMNKISLFLKEGLLTYNKLLFIFRIMHDYSFHVSLLKNKEIKRLFNQIKIEINHILNKMKRDGTNKNILTISDFIREINNLDDHLKSIYILQLDLSIKNTKNKKTVLYLKELKKYANTDI